MSLAPPPAPAYMLSLLTRRVQQAPEAFSTQHAGHWLVWEPGRWSASGIFEPTRSSSHDAPAPPDGDSLSFHLKVRQPIKVGRSGACHIVINDATVSREHLSLEPHPDGGWLCRVLSSSAATALDSNRLAPSSETRLESGQVIRVGDVSLTFYEAQDLLQRLTALRAPRVAPPA